MFVSVMSYSFRRLTETGGWDLPGVIRYVRELGVNLIELGDRDVRAGELSAVEAALAQSGVRVACYDLVCDVVSRDPAERKDRGAGFRASLGRAARLGATRVLVIPGPVRDGISAEDARRWFAEALSGSVDEAARYGITLTVENLGVPEMAFLHSDQVLALCEAVGPGLRVTYDAGNFLLGGEDTLQALERLASRVAHVHLKDWQPVAGPGDRTYSGADGRWYRGAALGTGVVNLRGAVDRLHRLGYRDTVSVEYEGIDEPREAVRRGVEYLHLLLEQQG